jgi:hypothetical protein
MICALDGAAADQREAPMTDPSLIYVAVAIPRMNQQGATEGNNACRSFQSLR